MLLEQLSENNKKKYLNLELCLASADGHFDELEKELVDAHCLEMGIDNNSYNIDLPYDKIIAKVQEDFSEKEKKITYIELISLALVDEVFTEEERIFVNKVKEILKISDEDAKNAESIMLNLINYSKALDDFVK